MNLIIENAGSIVVFFIEQNRYVQYRFGYRYSIIVQFPFGAVLLNYFMTYMCNVYPII